MSLLGGKAGTLQRPSYHLCVTHVIGTAIIGSAGGRGPGSLQFSYSRAQMYNEIPMPSLRTATTTRSKTISGGNLRVRIGAIDARGRDDSAIGAIDTRLFRSYQIAQM